MRLCSPPEGRGNDFNAPSRKKPPSTEGIKSADSTLLSKSGSVIQKIEENERANSVLLHSFLGVAPRSSMTYQNQKTAILRMKNLLKAITQVFLPLLTYQPSRLMKPMKRDKVMILGLRRYRTLKAVSELGDMS